MKYPACFDSEAQYIAWVHAARSAQAKIDHCRDCTAAYQARMIEQHRCEYPETVFELDEDGFISGMRPRHKRNENE
jgi:hypothetical protein